MRLPPMHAPAELCRQSVGNATRAGEGGDVAVVIARGPLVLMAHGLCAVEAGERGDWWIEADGERFSAEDTLALLRHWNTGSPLCRSV